MLKSLFNALLKIRKLFDPPNNKTCLTEAKANASKNGLAAATTGNNSPVIIGGHHVHHQSPDHSITAREAEKESESKFKHHLQIVAHELPCNFQNRGNAQNPFIIQALEKLVYDEPMIHKDPELFKKASHCLNIAKTLSNTSPYHPQFKPADGQFLMKELSQYIFHTYGIGPRL